MPLLDEIVAQIKAYPSLRLLSLEQLYTFLRIGSRLCSEIELSQPRSQSAPKLLPSNITNFLAETISLSEAQVIDLWTVCSHIVLDLKVCWEQLIENLARCSNLCELPYF